MRAARRSVLLALASALAAAPLPGQAVWIPPKDPCDLTPTASKVSSGLQALRGAVEKPDQAGAQLVQARKLFGEAILQDNQGANPAAWYYLGRAYVVAGDAAGADSALKRAESLAPKCAADIATYRNELWGQLINDGLAAWQDGRADSALAVLHAAARLEPGSPKTFATIAGLYASRGQDDSAFAYYRLAARTGVGDPAVAQDRRDALANAWHLVVRKVQSHPAAQRTGRVRAGLDSMQRGIGTDSVVLARLVASSQSRKARGAKLAPADQQLFTRDSAARTQAVSRQRAALAAARQQLAADSSALATAFGPAVDALNEYLAAYPGDVEAATSLATLYAQSGRADQAAAVLDSLSAHAGSLDPEVLFGLGIRMVGQGLYRPGARALVLGLARNPYRREALFSLAVACYQMHDTASLLPTAQRLVALDPLNRGSLRLVAAGWDLRGRRDSTHSYVARADSVLAVEVSVAGFVPDSVGASVSAVVANLKSVPSKPFRLTLELLDVTGAVVATQNQDVPALTPRQSLSFDWQVPGRGIGGWRYRAS
jgi:tetratricopeptide (TPR) repeat protein